MEQAKLHGRSMAGGGEGGHYILRVPYSLEGCDGWDGGGANIILTTVSSGKIYAPGGPNSGLKGIILFLGDE